MQMERLFPVWDRIDDMWRARYKYENLDLSLKQRKETEEQQKLQGAGFGMQSQQDPGAAKVSPAAPHKQMDAILNLGEAISFEKGQLPVEARKPKHVYENPLYNPTAQGVRAANIEIRRQAEEINLRVQHRKAFGQRIKYGHCFALTDFKRELETIECSHPLSPDPQLMQNEVLQLSQKYGYPPVRTEKDQLGRTCLVFQKTVPKVLRTDFLPLEVSACFIDEMIPCAPMERQPCPIVRTHISRWELMANEYDPMGNPFGWTNIQKALDDQNAQYALSEADEQLTRQLCLKRWGLSDSTGGIKPRNTIKQLWTAFPMLAIDPKTGKLDRGDGVPCPTCQGSGRVKPMIPPDPQEVAIAQYTAQPEPQPTEGPEQQCPTCAGKAKVYVKPQRYVVQMYGSLYGGGGCTVVRLQRNPTAKDKVPIKYSAHLVEDMTTSRPISKAEIALGATDQLATAHNQFISSKQYTIDRPYAVRQESPAWNVSNLNRPPNGKIPIEGNIDQELRRMDTTTYDDTATLINYIQWGEKEVQDIFGANDTVVGEISAGRRAASEITLANEGSKRPLVVQIDQFNRDMPGGWAQDLLDNLEHWQDRDWMKERTGMTTWGKLELFTAVGEEMLAKETAIGTYRYILELGATQPILQPILPKVLAMMFETLNLPISEDEIDGGIARQIQDGQGIVTSILGNGQLLPPSPDDPHEIYVGVFREALRQATTDPLNYWAQNAPQNVPLLFSRLMAQEQLLLKAQMQQMQMQDHQNQKQMEMQGQQEGAEGGSGNEPKRPGQGASTPGQQKQQQQGNRPQ